LDRALALVGGVWLINLVNFMDGIDWMTVAEIVPITAGLALFGLAARFLHPQLWLQSCFAAR
jgi:UDP-N-acetylmuramyl pentapeptide phosphotransferase/UDP-N-acetylglucosamine-1-phosphate transferase